VPLIFGVWCLVVVATHMVLASLPAAGEFFNGLLVLDENDDKERSHE
jgi:hypothetical protein